MVFLVSLNGLPFSKHMKPDIPSLHSKPSQHGAPTSGMQKSLTAIQGGSNVVGPSVKNITEIKFDWNHFLLNVF